MRRVTRDGQAQDQRLAGGQPGAVEIGQVDHAVDQLAVAAVLDSGQVRENAARIGRIVRQLDPVDRPTIERHRQRRGPGAHRVGLGIVLAVDPLRPVDALALGLRTRLEQVID